MCHALRRHLWIPPLSSHRFFQFRYWKKTHVFDRGSAIIRSFWNGIFYTVTMDSIWMNAWVGSLILGLLTPRLHNHYKQLLFMREISFDTWDRTPKNRRLELVIFLDIHDRWQYARALKRWHFVSPLSLVPQVLVVDHSNRKTFDELAVQVEPPVANHYHLHPHHYCCHRCQSFDWTILP